MSSVIATVVMAVLALSSEMNAQRHRPPGGGGGSQIGHGWRPGTITRSPVTMTTSTASSVETRDLDALYEAALLEGGRVIVYAGGDTAGQQDFTKNLFEKRFPNMTLDIIVDYSKFHGPRIDHQVAIKKLIPDVVQLQTLQDFPRWKAMGLLQSYKPIGWDQVYPEFKDPDGFYTGIYIIAFSNVISKILLPDNATWPTEANDYLGPEFKGKIFITYPNDDDAILFWFKNVVDKYGWSYVQEFAQQKPVLVRGTQEPSDAVHGARTPTCPATASDPHNLPESPAYFILPKTDPFMSWPQTAAIFKDAKRPAAAKLYLNYLLNLDYQKTAMWSIRQDGPPPAEGLRGIFDYPGQTDPTAFGKWMADRGQVERFKTQITLYLGEVTGEPSPGHLGILPEHALDH